MIANQVAAELPPSPTVNCDSNPSAFNTGVNADGSGVLADGATDANWQGSQLFPVTNPKGAVSLPVSPTWTPAVLGNQAPGAWANSPYGNAQWISATGGAGDGDWYYRYQFSLDPAVSPATFSLSLNFMSDNDAMEVWVNDVAQSAKTIGLPQAGAPNDPYQYGGFFLGNAASTVLNHDWQTGANSIIVQIKSGGGAEGFDVQARPGNVCPAPALTLTHGVTPDLATHSGQALDYTAVLHNTGNMALTGVGVLADSFTGQGSPPAFSCPSSTLAVGEFETCTAPYTVTGADMASSTISSSVTAHGTGQGLNDPTTTDAEVATVTVATPPVAEAVSGTTLQNTAADVAIQGTVDPSTTRDLTSVQLYDGAEPAWGTAVTVAGEGTWSVTSDGDLRFTPLIGFTGDSSLVTYRFSDAYGTPSSTSTAHMTVLPTLPTAAPVTASGFRGGTVILSPNGVGPTVPLQGGSLRLIDPSNGGRVTSLTLPDVGTFDVHAKSGTVEFTPLGSFVGSATSIYQVLDTLGRSATSLMTVRLDPISLTGETVTVDHGQTGSPTVSGAPDESVLTVPSSVPNATAVSISGSTVTLVPDASFSGRIAVPVTVVNGTATMTTSVVVRVRPAAVGTTTRGLTTVGTTVVHLPAHPAGVRYEVRVNGVLKCVTSARTCLIARLLGPLSKVTVSAVVDGVRGPTTTLPYRASTTRCVAVGSVHFSSNSARLGAGAQKKLNKVARLLKAQGFTHGCLAGHTDSTGSAAHNKALSKRRVHAVARYLNHGPHHTSFLKQHNGELDPTASNNSGSGRAANRSVAIGVM